MVLCSVRTRHATASSYAVGGEPSVSCMWSKASCACCASVRSIQLLVLDSRPCVTTPVGVFWWTSRMHRRISWAYARGSGLLSAAASANICLCAPYRLHVGRTSAGAHVADCRTRCMLFRTGSPSDSMGAPLWWMSRLLSSGGWAGCRCGGSLVVSASMMLLCVDVCDFAVGPSDVVSDVSLESVSHCWSCVWPSPNHTASMVSVVACCCCCASILSLCAVPMAAA